MFLVDKFHQDSNYISCHNKILENLIDSFDNHKKIYKKLEKCKSEKIFKETLKNMSNGSWRYSNLQHLIFYGPKGCGKEYLVKKLLETIYGSKNVKTSNVEYLISGYSSAKTLVTIKQSKYHIVIEPNNNGFDKYLIQEIINNYSNTEMLNITKQKRLYKIVIINKIDKLSEYAQASLRRTVEKVADKCKFIFICDQLSRVIEPLRSRFMLVRIPLPTNKQISKLLLNINIQQNLNLKMNEIDEIITKSENKINNAIWLLELHKNGYNYQNNWQKILDKLSKEIINFPNYSEKQYTVMTHILIKNLRQYFYILFTTNIDIIEIFRKLMLKLIQNVDDTNLKLRIIEITSIFEKRISLGTRYIIHFEAYVLRVVYLLFKYKQGKDFLYNLDSLEI